MSALQMPTTYLYGLPFYWRDEQTGVLPAAMQAYVFYVANPEGYPAPTADQLRLVIDYFRYVINAPCWRVDIIGKLSQARVLASGMTTIEQVEQFIDDCLAIGIDPI